MLVDSYYCSAAATGQSAAFRGYTPSTWGGVAPSGKVSVTTYTNMFLNVLAGNTSYRVRAEEGVSVELDISASLNNTEIYFRHAQWLQDLGDMSGLYLGQFEASALKRVRRLLIGSENTDYYNTNFTQASFDNCLKLETLNLGGLCNAARSFDFRPNLYLKDLYTRGSGVTGVTFAKQGRLQTARLNAVRSLSADTLGRLQTFEMPTYSELTTLSVEDTPALDTRAMAEGARSLQRVRLIGIDWQCENADTLVRLTRCAGRDDEGRDIPNPIVTGRVRIEAITTGELTALGEAFPELEVTYGQIAESYLITFRNWDDTDLCTIQVRQGESAPNPIAAGLIAEPVRASDVEKHYRYAGWDKSLGPITANTVIKAVFTASDRYYTVRYWYDDSENDLAQELRCIAHGSCGFTAADPEQEGTIWMGWDADASDVVSDMNIHAVYIVPRVPDSVPAQFDYLYSDDPGDDCAYTLAEFAGVLEKGLGKTYFQVGDRIKMVIAKNDTFTDTVIELMVLGFNHFRLTDGTGFAGVVFGMVGVMNSAHRMTEGLPASNEGGWPATQRRDFLNDEVFPALPIQWRKLIRRVEVRSSEGGGMPTIVASQDVLFLPSAVEVGFQSGVVPYCNEVDPMAETAVLPWFTDTSSRVRKQYNGTGSVQTWHLRSPVSSSTEGFVAVYQSGAENHNYSANMLTFVSWVCCMGGACV